MEQRETTPETAYEAPELVEIGEFAELTLGGGYFFFEASDYFGLA
ncbi:lasso RiPP family leader peptide-containing protein [Streptomyces spongiae]|uniref:Lasso RiPP family leader peptide-containing protein n=1 Tax=Streptomyces spongiae TaxID=565072 RepID=A0A5N8X8K0_9ACTN|nr:lasso RiPP family leader peptide-containing protein [Streptomyces spongiae]MPY55801.1 lasso RiPP family leader peptide-containing protein [Streptomyces spongiae]